MSGLTVTACTSSIAALHAIKTGWFDLYVLDSYLPNIDGFELCRRIREFDQRTPILFYSGAAQQSEIQKAIGAGANAYVIKPEIKQLLRKTTELLRRPYWPHNQRPLSIGKPGMPATSQQFLKKTATV